MRRLVAGARRVVVVLVAATLLPPLGVPWSVGAASRPIDASEPFDRYLAALHEFTTPTSFEHWDAASLGFELALEDADAIAEWVREEIALEVYRGVLRGADGVLQTRAGNAFDQSLLLSSLLADAGYDVRLARAEIPAHDAVEVVAAMRPRETRGADGGLDLEGFLGAVGGQYAAFAEMEARARELLDEAEVATDRLSGWIVDTLDRSGVRVGGAGVEDIVSYAREYVWVEYRLGSDEWTPIHVAAPPDADWTAMLEPDEVFTDVIPSDLQHRFRVAAVIERRRGGALEVETVMTTWERPVALLGHAPLTYQVVPDGLVDAGVGATSEEIADHTTFLIPTFAGDAAPGDVWFDTLGNVAPASAAGDPAGGVFGGLSRSMAGALDATAGEEDLYALTAHWLEVTFVEPGGTASEYRRMVFDRLGEERRARGDAQGPLDAFDEAAMLDRLRTPHTLMVAPGRYHPAFVAVRSAEAAEQVVEYQRALYEVVEQAEGDDVVPPVPEGLDAAIGAALMLQHLQALDESPVRGDGALLSYRPVPMLAMLTNAVDGSERSLDIVQSRRAVVSFDGSTAVKVPEQALREGVWESVAEGLVLAADRERHDTATFFDAVDAAGVGVRVLGPERGDAVDELALPIESREAIRRDLGRGYVVIAAEAMPDGEHRAAWWRVRPDTGETLGRGGDGRGGVLLDRISLEGIVAGLLIGTVFGGAGFAACAAGTGRVGCCLVDAGAGLVIGAIVGVAFASAAVGLVVAAGLDLGVALGGIASLAGLPWPSTCLLVERDDAFDRLAWAAHRPDCMPWAPQHLLG